MKPVRAFLLLTLLLASVCPAFAQTLTGRVIGVSDGDTIKVLTPAKQQIRVRLNGVDAPESRQAYGTRAKQFTSAMVFGKDVSVQTTDTDRYGRTVANVSVNGLSLNQELVRAGLAWWYKRYAPNDATLARLESEARQAKRGLWADANPVAPWDFRHGGKATKVGTSRTPNRVAAATSSGRGSSASGFTLPRAAQVYVTRTGDKYHRAGCRYLRRSQIPMSLKDAEAHGYRPCSVCRP